MVDQILTEVKINGSDISTNKRLRTWESLDTFGDTIQDIKIQVTKGILTDIPTLKGGMTVTVKRGFTTATDEFTFDGFIDKIDLNGPYITIRAKDKLLLLKNASVTYSFDGVAFPGSESKGSDIATTLIETHGGMTAQVEDTGPNILKKFISIGNDVIERLRTLAAIYDYQIYFNASTGKVHFESLGFLASTDQLYAGAGALSNCTNMPNWEFDSTQLLNEVTIRGAVQEVRDTEKFDGDNTASQVFTLTKKPITMQVFEVVGGSDVEKLPGVTGSTSGTFDYEVDKENKTITATSNWTPASGTNNVKIVYSNAIPVPVLLDDETSQTDNNMTVSTTRFFNDIQSVDDAERRGQALIDKYKDPFVQVMLKPTSIISFKVGQSVLVTDLTNNQTRTLVVNSIKKTYPHQGDEVRLGDKEYRLAEWGKFTIERIRRLEEQTQQNTDLLVTIKNFPHIVKPHRRYLKGTIRTVVAGQGGIYNHATEAVYNTSKYGNGFGAETLETEGRLVWPSKLVIEKFIDTDFEGSGDAEWSTSTQSLIFTNS